MKEKGNFLLEKVVDIMNWNICYLPVDLRYQGYFPVVMKVMAYAFCYRL